MPRTLAPSVAGLFYPGEPAVLRREVDELLAAAAPATEIPKAIIVPHAGYVYSGPIAASAYAALAAVADRIQRVVLLAPSHRLPFRGLAVPSAEIFLTPLGGIEVDRPALDALADLPQVQLLDQAFAGEHALEVQLPFLQRTLTQFRLVPLILGEATPQVVAAVLDRLWGGAETLIVVSSDLSHYQSYATARRRDRATGNAIEQLDWSSIGYDDACGRTGINGLLVAARHHGLHVRTLDLRNSGDTAGPRDRVVGYGAFTVH